MRPVLTLLAILLVPCPSLPAQEVAPSGPDADSLAPVTPELPPGARIRMRGETVDHLGRPTGSEIFTYGLVGAHLLRGQAEGVVLFADPDSVVFTDRKRGGVVSVEWSLLESVELYRGRDAGRGALQGAAWGALGGLLMWGAMEVIFSGESWDVDGGPIVAISVAGGAIGGALTLGDRWERVRLPGR